ncbi:MAG: alpha/beta hydrolase [Lachnospiraceae bacterium]|nr:alpha/beta hydrolase [Lachnospiraceae bacterium]
MKKTFRKILFVLAALLLILRRVSLIFIKNILKAVPNRNEAPPESPASAEDCLEISANAADCTDNPAKATYMENRRKLRAMGNKFEQTMKNASITNRDGLLLRAKYRLQDSDTHRWIISIHGYKDSHHFMLPYGAVFYRKGYHVLLPDNRAHGISEGKYIGMGWLDKEDIAEWIQWIVNQDAEAKIILHGVSMGGATVMMTAGKNLDHVVGYIEDCGYTSVWDIFACVMKRDYHLPAFPILHTCRAISRRKLGYDYVEASALTQLANCNKPMLFIHGEKDDFVPTDMGYEVYEAFPGKKELYIAKEAGHANAMDYDPQTYFTKVFTFIDHYICFD